MESLDRRDISIALRVPTSPMECGTQTVLLSTPFISSIYPLFFSLSPCFSPSLSPITNLEKDGPTTDKDIRKERCPCKQTCGTSLNQIPTSLASLSLVLLLARYLFSSLPLPSPPLPPCLLLNRFLTSPFSPLQGTTPPADAGFNNAAFVNVCDWGIFIYLFINFVSFPFLSSFIFLFMYLSVHKQVDGTLILLVTALRHPTPMTASEICIAKATTPSTRTLLYVLLLLPSFFFSCLPSEQHH